MKKYFIASFLLPFSLFAAFDYNGYTINRSKVFYYTGFDTTLAQSKAELYSPTSESDLFPIYFNNTFGFKVTFSSTNTQRSPSVPSPTSIFTNGVSSAFSSIAYPFNGSKDSVNYGISPFFFPSLSSLYFAAASLFENGYRGSGVTYFSSGSTYCVNVNFTELIPDVLSSTNTVYRQILLSNLASITSSLSSIDLKLSDIYNSISSSSSPVYTYSNIVASAEGLQAFAANTGFNLDLQKIESYVNPSNWDLEDPEGILGYQAALQSYGKGLQQLSDLIGMASALNSSDGVDKRYNGLQQLGNAINGSVDASINDFKRLSTNWQEGVKKDLQDWRNDVTNRLAHMFDDNIPIDGGNSSPVYVSGQNGGPVGVVGVVRLEGPISVGATIEGPVTLDATQINQFSSGWESIRQSIIDFHNSFSDFTSSGDLPFNWISFYRLFYDFQNQSLTNQVALLHNLNYTNILENIYVAITNKDTNVVISAALLDDYENFVDTSKFSSIVSSLPDNLRDSLSRFGLLDSSDYSGRWWVFQAANMALQSQLALTNAALASLLSSSLQSLDDYFSDDDDPSSGLLSSWLNIIDGLPDPEELQQTISEATNIVSNVGLERVTVLYDRATNDFSSVVSSVYSDRSLPPTLSFVLIPGKNGSPDRVVNVPVSDRSSLWSFIRQGMAFGLSVVTLILFPKYLLWLLAHYTRLLEKIIKSLHAYTEH